MQHDIFTNSIYQPFKKYGLGIKDMNKLQATIAYVTTQVVFWKNVEYRIWTSFTQKYSFS